MSGSVAALAKIKPDEMTHFPATQQYGRREHLLGLLTQQGILAGHYCVCREKTGLEATISSSTH